MEYEIYSRMGSRYFHPEFMLISPSVAHSSKLFHSSGYKSETCIHRVGCKYRSNILLSVSFKKIEPK